METLFKLDEPDWSSPWTTRIIDTPTAKRWLGAYHYLGGTHAMWSFGVFGPDLVAVVSLGQPANRHGVASKFKLDRWPGNHEITRVGVHPDAPRNAASKALALVCRAYRQRGHDWLFSYADTGQGHHGGIYQALNAVYVGLSPARSAWLLDGEEVHIRTLSNRYGFEGERLVVAMAEEGRSLERVAEGRSPKHTYILPIGSPNTRRAIRRHLTEYKLPYPKRSVGGNVADSVGENDLRLPAESGEGAAVEPVGDEIFDSGQSRLCIGLVRAADTNGDSEVGGESGKRWLAHR